MAESDEPPRAYDDIAALRAKYEAVTGKRPSMGWSAGTLQTKIATAEVWEQYRYRYRYRPVMKHLAGIGVLTRLLVFIVGGLLWLAGLLFFYFPTAPVGTNLSAA